MASRCDLLADAQAVLDNLTPREREVHTVDGASYLARIQPYRTLDNVIEGVVLTFNDITEHVRTEAAVREAREMAEGIIDTVRETLVVLSLVTASRAFYNVFRVRAEDTVGRRFYELGNRQWDIPALRELLETILPRDQTFDGYMVEHDFPVIGRCKMALNDRRKSLPGKSGNCMNSCAPSAARKVGASRRCGSKLNMNRIDPEHSCI